VHYDFRKDAIGMPLAGTSFVVFRRRRGPVR
jgi:hypothetical protein